MPDILHLEPICADRVAMSQFLLPNETWSPQPILMSKCVHKQTISYLKGIIFHQWYVLLINQCVLCLKTIEMHVYYQMLFIHTKNIDYPCHH